MCLCRLGGKGFRSFTPRMWQALPEPGQALPSQARGPRGTQPWHSRMAQSALPALSPGKPTAPEPPGHTGTRQVPVLDEKTGSGWNSVKRLTFTWKVPKTSSPWGLAWAGVSCGEPASGASTPPAPEGPGPTGERRNGSTEGSDGALGHGFPGWRRRSSGSPGVPAAAGGFWKSCARGPASRLARAPPVPES